MKTISLQLLPTTAQGTPSGNYDGSSLDFSGVPVPAANYYGGAQGLQTVAIFVNLFRGRLIIQASLDTQPTLDNQWFQVYDLNAPASTTQNFAVNITGNFVWIRARVINFTAGTINQVQLSY